MQPGVPDPPAQSWNPLSIRAMPMSMTVGPVTSGGKTRFKMAGLVNERPISSREHRQAVPSRAP